MKTLSKEWFTVRKKPVEVEARGPYFTTDQVETLEGDHEVSEEYIEEHGGYYIIKGVEDELYPCAANIFEQTYDRVEEVGPLFTAEDVGAEITDWKMKLLKIQSNFQEAYFGDSELDKDEIVDHLMNQMRELAEEMRDRTKELKNEDSGSGPVPVRVG